MRTFNKLPHWQDQLLRLTEADKQNPCFVLDDFFSFFHLQDMREILWDWLTTALSTDSGRYSTAFERSNLLFAYEKLELLVEAAYLMYKRRKQKEKQYAAMQDEWPPL